MLSSKKAAESLGVSVPRVQALLRQGRIVGAQKVGRDWVIPAPVKVKAGSRTRPGVINPIASSNRAGR